MSAKVRGRDIAQLAEEAYAHGDDAQRVLCVKALNGDAAAWKECERVILEARARGGAQ
jgi:hypothetical protein